MAMSLGTQRAIIGPIVGKDHNGQIIVKGSVAEIYNGKMKILASEFPSLSRYWQLYENDDLNSVVITGSYLATDNVAATITNSPYATSFMLEVGFADMLGERLYQRCTEVSTGNQSYRTGAKTGITSNWRTLYESRLGQ